jgi:hypothetical protein
MVSSLKHCSLLLESMARVQSVQKAKNPTSCPVGFGKKTDDKKLFLTGGTSAAMPMLSPSVGWGWMA